MKPKQLHYPFSWEERKPLYQDRILWVPEYYHDYSVLQFPEWQHEDLFGNTNPVHVEYCSGNGSWLIEKASEDPNRNWVAIEKRFDRVRKIWSKLKNRDLRNVIVVCGEGLCATESYFRDGSVDAVYVNFPDPWPKDRHAKHRIIQRPFVDQMARILKADGTVTLVTDDATYSEQMQAEMQHPAFRNLAGDAGFITELPGYGSSFFEELWRSKGLQVRYHQFTAAAYAD